MSRTIPIVGENRDWTLARTVFAASPPDRDLEFNLQPEARAGRVLHQQRVLASTGTRALGYNGHMTQIDSTAEARTRYRRTMLARTQRDARALAERKRRALVVAKRAASVLADEFGATRVVLFGSLAHGLWFSSSSDIDLAAWGLGPEEHLVALSRLEDLGRDLRISVVRAEYCTDALSTAIETEGVAL